MKAAILFGDSSVTLDKPIGERNNSPVVIKKYPRKTKRKGTFPFSPMKWAVAAKIRNPNPN